MREQFEARVEEELEKRKIEETQRLKKKLWTEEYQRELKIQRERATTRTTAQGTNEKGTST